MRTFKNGKFVEDSYAFVDKEDEIPSTGKIVLAVERFLDCVDFVVSRSDNWGVRLDVECDPLTLVPWIKNIRLIEVLFPKFSDGRGFSVAQLLRRRLGYAGELRAVGDIGLDQVNYLQRSGFDAFDLSDLDLPAVKNALGAFSNVYQPAADKMFPIFNQRLAGSRVDAIH